MVATRRRYFLSGPQAYGSSGQDQYNCQDDLEGGIVKPSQRSRFRDLIHQAVDIERERDIKRKLREGIDKEFFERCRKPSKEIKQIKNKKVRKYYEQQNERLNDWLEIDTLVANMAEDVLDSMNPRDEDNDGVAEVGGALQNTGESIEPLLPEDEREKRRKGQRRAKWAININVIANVLLLVAKCVAAFYSDSLSLIASLVDSALDLLCTLIVWSTNKLVGWRLNRLKKKFPVGRKRLEPLGILVFSVIMVISFLQIAQESIEKLTPGGKEPSAEPLPAIAIGAMAATIVVKGIIWFGCIPIKTTQVQALAQDCKTDVFFNTLSLLFPLLGSKLGVPLLDPIGALVLSIFIIYDWASTCVETISRLTGVAANDRTFQRMLYLAYRFTPVVAGLKKITAYHAGDGIWVEMDVLVDHDEKVKNAHDVAETLQYCCEGLAEVDRAFVTVDYTFQGPTGHAIESS